MAGLSKVEWLGKEIELRVIKATVSAIDEITHAAAEDAQGQHWWSNRTGDLARNTFAEPAKLEGAEVKGRFGSGMRSDGFYGLFLERKTPWLRPAADRHFHGLGLKIKGGLRWM